MNKPFSAPKRQNRSNLILATAKRLFLERGIEDVTMTDIAKGCSLGVATLYRYFRVKRRLVIQTAVLIWKDIDEEFAEISRENSHQKRDGITSLRHLVNHFYDLFKRDKSFFLFVRDFDAYAAKESLLPAELSEYDQIFLHIKDLFVECAKIGRKDGTIRQDIDFDLVYFAFSSAIPCLAWVRNSIGESALVPSDQAMKDSDRQIRWL
jgi:AcrR family transcriptional regulator